MFQLETSFDSQSGEFKSEKVTNKKIKTAEVKKVAVAKKAAPKPKVKKPKSEVEVLKEKIELKQAEHRKAASKGPRAAAQLREELIALKDKLSKIL